MSNADASTSLSALTALSPLDGRYRDKVAALAAYFSEYGLIRHRIHVEIVWLQALADEASLRELTPFSKPTRTVLADAVASFSAADADRVKAIERTTNHDVKAIEYWMKERFAATPEIARVAEFIHFACTSEDINNLAYGLMLAGARREVLLPAVDALIADLRNLAHAHAALPMLARTHGQPATPTTLGKEIANVVSRLALARAAVAEVPLAGKINGAVGNYNAHRIAYPDLDWQALSRRVVTGLGLEFRRTPRDRAARSACSAIRRARPLEHDRHRPGP
jgi:adenylosuccinate lyase